MAAFSCEEVILDLQKQGVILGKKGKADVAEESRFAYKNIKEVMDNQQDLVVPVKRLKTIGVVKGYNAAAVCRGREKSRRRPQQENGAGHPPFPSN